MVNRRTSSECRAGKGAERGSGGSRMVGQCGRRTSVKLGHWPLPCQPIHEGFIDLLRDDQVVNIGPAKILLPKPPGTFRCVS